MLPSELASLTLYREGPSFLRREPLSWLVGATLLWRQWSTEYLTTLQARTKWSIGAPNVRSVIIYVFTHFLYIAIPAQ